MRNNIILCIAVVSALVGCEANEDATNKKIETLVSSEEVYVVMDRCFDKNDRGKFGFTFGTAQQSSAHFRKLYYINDMISWCSGGVSEIPPGGKLNSSEIGSSIHVFKDKSSAVNYVNEKKYNDLSNLLAVSTYKRIVNVTYSPYEEIYRITYNNVDLSGIIGEVKITGAKLKGLYSDIAKNIKIKPIRKTPDVRRLLAEAKIDEILSRKTTIDNIDRLKKLLDNYFKNIKDDDGFSNLSSITGKIGEATQAGIADRVTWEELYSQKIIGAIVFLKMFKKVDKYIKRKESSRDVYKHKILELYPLKRDIDIWIANNIAESYKESDWTWMDGRSGIIKSYVPMFRGVSLIEIKYSAKTGRKIWRHPLEEYYIAKLGQIYLDSRKNKSLSDIVSQYKKLNSDIAKAGLPNTSVFVARKRVLGGYRYRGIERVLEEYIQNGIESDALKNKSDIDSFLDDVKKRMNVASVDYLISSNTIEGFKRGLN